jgi:hypothetical protein
MADSATGEQERAAVMRKVAEALQPENARAHEYPNFSKLIEIKTCYVGPHSGDASFGIVFEVKIQRSAYNDLGMTIRWNAGTNEEAIAFLRELADMIAGSTGT